jgi:hypothetical protein
MNRILLGCLLLAILSSCYCRKITYELKGGSHPRWLGNLHVFPVDRLCFGDGKKYQAHVYYGLPSQTESVIRDEYTSAGTSAHEFKTIGQFGARFERYISPGFTKFAVLGVGLDYNHQREQFSYQMSAGKEELNFESNRLALSANLFTLITKFGLTGYTTLQAGTAWYDKSYQGPQTNFQFNDPLQNGKLDYRGGYGFQYFPVNGFGVSIEGGYGRGAYARIGAVLWF